MTIPADDILTSETLRIQVDNTTAEILIGEIPDTVRAAPGVRADFDVVATAVQIGVQALDEGTTVIVAAIGLRKFCKIVTKRFRDRGEATIELGHSSEGRRRTLINASEAELMDELRRRFDMGQG